MDKEQYDELVAKLKARHLERISGDNINDHIARTLYEAMDEEFVKAGELTQAEQEAQVVMQIMAIAADLK